MKKSTLSCPSCSSKISVYRSEKQTDISSIQYVECKTCSAKYKIVVSFCEQITPPCLPYDDQSDLRRAGDVAQLIECAVLFFLKRARSSENTTAHCVDHLLGCFSISKKTAVYIAAIAKAQITKPNGFCIQQITDAAVVIRRGINEEVIIPLSKLIAVAGFNETEKKL